MYSTFFSVLEFGLYFIELGTQMVRQTIPDNLQYLPLSYRVRKGTCKPGSARDATVNIVTVFLSLTLSRGGYF